MKDNDKQYKLMELSEKELSPDPYKQFEKWYTEIIDSDFPFPNSFILSTADKKGHISSRVLLFKGYDENGFKFYTNENSKKGKDLIQNKNASMCFWWDSLERQIRIEGSVLSLSTEEADHYFQTRPRGSQIGAWASNQSEPISNRTVLDDAYKKYDEKYKNNEIPRPDYWKGFILMPRTFEYWQGRDNRLHDRFLYTKKNNSWLIQRLAP